jgi:hypothetical protein
MREQNRGVYSLTPEEWRRLTSRTPHHPYGSSFSGTRGFVEASWSPADCPMIPWAMGPRGAAPRRVGLLLLGHDCDVVRLLRCYAEDRLNLILTPGSILSRHNCEG